MRRQQTSTHASTSSTQRIFTRRSERIVNRPQCVAQVRFGQPLVPQDPRTRFARHSKAYNVYRYHQPLCQHSITSRIARSGIQSREQLSRHRWVVERTLAWPARSSVPARSCPGAAREGRAGRRLGGQPQHPPPPSTSGTANLASRRPVRVPDARHRALAGARRPERPSPGAACAAARLTSLPRLAHTVPLGWLAHPAGIQGTAR
jgi:hypothetical protein